VALPSWAIVSVSPEPRSESGHKKPQPEPAQQPQPQLDALEQFSAKRMSPGSSGRSQPYLPPGISQPQSVASLHLLRPTVADPVRDPLNYHLARSRAALRSIPASTAAPAPAPAPAMPPMGRDGGAFKVAIAAPIPGSQQQERHASGHVQTSATRRRRTSQPRVGSRGAPRLITRRKSKDNLLAVMAMDGASGGGGGSGMGMVGMADFIGRPMMEQKQKQQQQQGGGNDSSSSAGGLVRRISSRLSFGAGNRGRASRYQQEYGA